MNHELVERLLALIEASPHDDTPQLVLADHLSELGDPRGELLVLDALDRAGRLVRPDQLERMLLLAAEYTFPTRVPEPPMLAFRRVVHDQRFSQYRVASPVTALMVTFTSPHIEFVVETGEPMPRTPDPHADDNLHHEGYLFSIGYHYGELGEDKIAACLPVISDWLRYRVPFDELWFPFETNDQEAPPVYDAGPLRIAELPADYRVSRRVPYGRFGLAGRDYARWYSTYQRVEAMLRP